MSSGTLSVSPPLWRRVIGWLPDSLSHSVGDYIENAPKRDSRRAEAMSGFLFKNDNFRDDYGIFNSRHLFVINPMDLEPTLQVLEPLIRQNYRRSGRVQDDLKIHKVEIDLSKEPYWVKDDFRHAIDTPSPVYPNIFIVRIKNVQGDAQVKMDDLFKHGGSSKGMNNSRIIWVSDEASCFENIHGQPKDRNPLFVVDMTKI